MNKTGRLRRNCNLLVFFLVTLYLGLSPITFYQLEFQPEKATEYEPEKQGINREDIFFTSKNGSRLHAWYFKTAGAIETVLFHHGRGGNVATYLEPAHQLVAAGANVFVYDYEGYGLSNGQPNNANVCNDAEAAYHYLVDKEFINPKDLVEFGASLGTGLACRMAEHHPCAGLILISPYKSIEAIAQFHLPFLRLYPSFFYPQPDLGIGRLFKDKKTPLLMAHAIHDPLFPVAHADEIFQQSKGPKTYFRLLLPPGRHLSGLGVFSASLYSAFFKRLPGKPNETKYWCEYFKEKI